MRRHYRSEFKKAVCDSKVTDDNQWTIYKRDVTCPICRRILSERGEPWEEVQAKELLKPLSLREPLD